MTPHEQHYDQDRWNGDQKPYCDALSHEPWCSTDQLCAYTPDEAYAKAMEALDLPEDLEPWWEMAEQNLT